VKNFLKIVVVVVFCALYVFESFAGTAPVRGSSQNGVDVNAPFWNLAGPTAGIPRKGGTVLLETQIVCTNQMVSAAVDNTNVADAGTCVDGAYTFLFQIQTTATTLTVSLTNLVGFTASTSPATYGIAVCDNDPNNPQASNTQQLCSQATGIDLSAITATVNKKSAKITITVPSIPAFPAGVGKQGQGLTFVVVEQQTGGQPIAVPKIAF
jgi:hypothetical protein